MLGKKKKITIILSLVLAVIIAVSSFFCVRYILIRKQQKEWDALVESYYAMKLDLYAEENERYADYEVDVAFLGDSLTDGYDLKKYYPQYVTANRGIGGETTFGLEKRMQVSVYDLKPKVAVMLIGGNNFDSMFDNYEDILIGLQKNLPQTKVVLLSLTAMGGEHWGRKNQIATYNNVIIKLLAEKYNFTFVDLYTPMFDVAIGEVYADYTLDGGHLNEKGYEVATSIITPVLEGLLGY